MSIKIEIVGSINDEYEAFRAACTRVLRWGDDTSARIHTNPREDSGWLEWLIVIDNADGTRAITIGLIQREPGAPFECHS